MTAAPDPRTTRSGLLAAFGAYSLWGGLPLYFLLVAPAGAIEVVAFRIVFSLVFCAILLAATRSFRSFGALFTDRRLVATMGAAGVLIVVNWTTFIFATLSGQLVEAALGYFVNPVVTVLLGVLVLGERLRPAQWTAVAISLVAIVVIAVGYGRFPWISLILAFSFGFYGLVKKQVGGRIGAVHGLALETLLLSPAAATALVVIGLTGGMVFGHAGPGQALAVVGLGVVTAVPLLLFAASARRLPLSTIGLTQYLTPILQLVVGIALLHEPMSAERWVGFGLIWAALAILSYDALRGSRPRRLSAPTSRIANETPS